MRNVFRIGNGGTDGVLRSHPRLGKSIVAGVKVFAILLHLREYVLVGGELSVETEQLLLFLSHLTDVDLVLPGWQHRGRRGLESVC